jgi:hypothetical protein
LGCPLGVCRTQALKEELQLRIDALQHEAAQHKRESKRMDQKMVYIQR